MDKRILVQANFSNYLFKMQEESRPQDRSHSFGELADAKS